MLRRFGFLALVGAQGCAASHRTVYPPPPNVYVQRPPAYARPAPPGPRASVAWGSSTWVETPANQWQGLLRVSITPPPVPPRIQLEVEFRMVSYAERALVEGNRVVTESRPTPQAQPQVESVPVSFTDPVSGRALDQAAATVTVHRANGFAAGEYRVTVKTALGRRLAPPATVILQGNNPLVDRRPGTFAK